MLFRSLVLLVLLLPSMPTAVAQSVVGSVTRFGIYEMIGPPQGPWRIGSVTETLSIPARRGVRFGLEFEARGIAEASVMFNATLRHPPMTKPGGEVISVSTVQMGPFRAVNGVVGSSYGFTFDHEYELVPGAWAIEIAYKGNVIAQKQFTVVPGT